MRGRAADLTDKIAVVPLYRGAPEEPVEDMLADYEDCFMQGYDSAEIARAAAATSEAADMEEVNLGERSITAHPRRGKRKAADCNFCRDGRKFTRDHVTKDCTECAFRQHARDEGIERDVDYRRHKEVPVRVKEEYSIYEDRKSWEALCDFCHRYGHVLVECRDASNFFYRKKEEGRAVSRRQAKEAVATRARAAHHSKTRAEEKARWKAHAKDGGARSRSRGGQGRKEGAEPSPRDEDQGSRQGN
jgi:hypothetical protein